MNIKTITEEELFEDLNNRDFGSYTYPVKIIPENPEDEPVVLVPYDMYVRFQEPEDLRTPDEWLEDDDFKGVIVMDPDGWDRQNYEESWAEKITRDEFGNRMGRSTCQIPGHVMDRIIKEAEGLE